MAFRSGPLSDILYSPASAVGGSGTTALGTAAPSYASIGATENGIIHTEDLFDEDIHTDAGGGPSGIVVDQIELGGQPRVKVIAVEYSLFKAVLSSRITPSDGLANVGALGTARAGPLIVTPKAGTTWATELGTGNSRVYYKARLLTSVDYMIGAGLTKGPMTFICYPDPNNGNKFFATIVTPS